jgi:ribonuclease-3 family protein
LNIEEFLPINKTPEEINELSPLVWAYVGDCIYELYIRTYLVETTKLKPHSLHVETVKYVKASAQAEILKNIEDSLNDEEKDIVRRARNANQHHLPKNASVQEYMYATAFEALIGYLYLNKNFERVKEILQGLLI